MAQDMHQNAASVAAVQQPPAAPHQLYNVLSDLSHNIAEFDGLSGPGNVSVWLKQL